jgi:hypothetical protein
MSSGLWEPEDEPAPQPLPRTDRERALEMAVFAASELVGALRKARGADRRRQRHLAQLLSADTTGPDTWGALSDEERQFVFADDPPRDALLARVADVLRRSGVDDGDALVIEIERRLV